MQLYLSRQRVGSYMLTAFRPVLSRIGNTGTQDLYMQVGDPVGFRHMCPFWVAETFGGLELQNFEVVKVELTGTVLSEKQEPKQARH